MRSATTLQRKDRVNVISVREGCLLTLLERPGVGIALVVITRTLKGKDDALSVRRETTAAYRVVSRAECVLLENTLRVSETCRAASALPGINQEQIGAVVMSVVPVPIVITMDVRSVDCVNEGRSPKAENSTARIAFLVIIKIKWVSESVDHVVRDGTCK